MKNPNQGRRWRNSHIAYNRRRAILFPRHPTGPFCFLKQEKHSTRNRSARRLERRFKSRQREELLS